MLVAAKVDHTGCCHYDFGNITDAISALGKFCTEKCNFRYLLMSLWGKINDVNQNWIEVRYIVSLLQKPFNQLRLFAGFWMAFGDFLKYFQDLDICHISHDVDQDITFHGRWEDGLNAGGVQKADWKNFAKNPQCFIRLSDSDPIDPQGRSSAVVSLMQRRQPNSRAKGMNKVGIIVTDAVVIINIFAGERRIRN